MSELIHSDTAKKYGIDNMPYNTEVLDNLLLLIANVLQPLRDYVNRPIIINSGYRSYSLNANVGGVINSQHLTGQAADFTIKGLTVKQTMELVKKSGVPFDQLIDEKTWVHISYNKTKKSYNSFYFNFLKEQRNIHSK